MINDKDRDIMYSLVSNPSLDVDGITEIFKYFSLDIPIVMEILNHSKCPQEILLELTDKYFDLVENGSTADVQVQDGTRVLLGVSQCDNAPRDLLIKLSESKASIIRLGVARHINKLPKDIVKELVNDPSSRVREKAKYIIKEKGEKRSFIEDIIDKIDNVVHKWLS
jgi:hypothetical protein